MRPRYYSWHRAIKDFLADKQADNELTSASSIRAYRSTLELHSDDAHGGPATTTRDDVKRTLRRWPNPNGRRTRHAHLVSFYDWAVQEAEMREANPARAVKRTRGKRPDVIRWTLDEAARFVAAAQTEREKRVAYLGVLQGFRLGDLIAVRGADFRRPGFVYASTGKGGRRDWLPLLDEVVELAEEIRRSVPAEEYVIHAMRSGNPAITTRRELRTQPASRGAIRGIVEDVAKRAGLGHATPHVMRRAFADFVYHSGGDLKLTQALMRHSRLSTTDTYLSELSPDQLFGMVRGLSLRPPQAVPYIAVVDGAVPPSGEANPPRTGVRGQFGREAGLAAIWFAEVAARAAERGAFYREALG